MNMKKMNQTLLLLLSLMAIYATLAYEGESPYGKTTCDPETLKDCNAREKKYVIRAKKEFAHPDFLEDEIEVVEKEFRALEKEEIDSGVTFDEGYGEDERKDWAARRKHILLKIQDVHGHKDEF